MNRDDRALRVALVLGAGGAPGGAFIRACFAGLDVGTGWGPNMTDTVIGTSVGALNAARISSEPATVERGVAERLVELAGRLPPPEQSLADRLLATPRQLGGRLVGRLAPAGSHTPDYDVATPPFHPGVHVVSCRRSNGERRVTRLATADDPSAELYASAAIPGFSPPVEIDGDEHVDGAVWSTTNADLVPIDDHDLLIVIAPMVARDGGSLLRRGHRASLLAELQPWVGAGRPVVYLAPSAAAFADRKNHEAMQRDARALLGS